jgi:hypothetical protein
MSAKYSIRPASMNKLTDGGRLAATVFPRESMRVSRPASRGWRAKTIAQQQQLSARTALTVPMKITFGIGRTSKADLA